MELPKNAISIRGIKKTYKSVNGSPEKQVLKGFDLDIERGSIFALLGPNGAGKSTLINIMAGLSNKSDGTVKIWGMDIDEDPRNSKCAIGIVPQEINIDPFFTPIKLLDLHAGLYGVPKSERKTEQILNSVGLWDKRHAYTRQMSGGMRRRLLIAKAMVHSPPILVLDEPTAGVDIELRQQLWNNIRTLNKNGTTILLTTHYLEEAEQLCDRIAVIDKGQLVANSTKQQLLKSMDKKTATISFNSKFNPIHTPKGTDCKIINYNTINLSFPPSKINIADILNQLEQQDYVISDITTVDSNLEDLFLQLTSNKK